MKLTRRAPTSFEQAAAGFLLASMYFVYMFILLPNM